MQIQSLKTIERLVRYARDQVFQNKIFPDINHLLHHARGVEFGRLPKGIDHVVSVGCAGKWYFDWIEKAYGPVKKHVGVEFYSPKPSDLPSNVEWIRNTAGNMPEIPDECTQMVISGQNLEHLWPEDVVGFFLESYRILKPHGLLVVDSPNRDITKLYNWSHPEHTVELTPQEATELATLAGFHVTEVKGLWLCKSQRTGKLFKFDDMSRYGEGGITHRLNAAQKHPDDSFLWWIEARKGKHLPNEVRLKERMKEIWNQNWPERCQRTISIVGKITGNNAAYESNGQAGVVMYGPYLPLRTGSYTVCLEMELLDGSLPQSTQVISDVVAEDGNTILSRKELTLEPSEIGNRVKIDHLIETDRTLFGVQFRVIVSQGTRIRVFKNPNLVAKQGW